MDQRTMCIVTGVTKSKTHREISPLIISALEHFSLFQHIVLVLLPTLLFWFTLTALINFAIK